MSAREMDNPQPSPDWFEHGPTAGYPAPEDAPMAAAQMPTAPLTAAAAGPGASVRPGSAGPDAAPGVDLPLPLGRGIRLRSIVFGMLLALIAVTVPLTHYTSVRVDGTALAIGALIAAGVLLLFGGLASVARERRRVR